MRHVNAQHLGLNAGDTQGSNGCLQELKYATTCMAISMRKILVSTFVLLVFYSFQPLTSIVSAAALSILCGMNAH